jgi:hypothetical protein
LQCSGDRFVTFDGIAKACAKAMGAPEPELVHFNAKDFDFGKEKAFPMRDQHFFASVDKVSLGGMPGPGEVLHFGTGYHSGCLIKLPPPSLRPRLLLFILLFRQEAQL